jgi:DNA polymerase I-like protein with 3'-5' exonuclease and polymerase domains
MAKVVIKTDISPDDLKPKKAKKTKEKEPRDMRTMFHKLVASMDIEKLKKPWMAQKAFQLVNTKEGLQAWADSVLNDPSRYFTIGKESMPVIAVDTETVGLDTRVVVDMQQNDDGSWQVTYEVNIEISGICLSSDGIEGIYIPITHEGAENIDRLECAKILQKVFDRSHLVFYNAKYDREVLRLTMGIDFRPYPYFEDVQVLAYINDPKADLGDKGKFTGEAGGLKALSKNVLGIEQIEIDQVAKVKCDFLSPDTGKVTQKNQHVPFSWVPVEVALWYAAGDAICTWLLWEKMHGLARTRKLVHRTDHELVDTITWIERQRWLVDTSRLERTQVWHTKKIGELRDKLRALALEAGFKEKASEEGVVTEDDKFNPGSNPQLSQLFFKLKGFKVTKITGAGNPSCDAEVLEDLEKAHPEDEFLKMLMVYRDYVALHPDKLRFDPRDHSARIYLKQNVVAGGRLAAAGGDFEKDGGFGLNPQGIKKIESHLMWKVYGNVLEPDSIPVEEIEQYTESDLHKSCFKDIEEEVLDRTEITADGKDLPIYRKEKKRVKAPGIVNNHIGQYMGYAICLVPKCTSCTTKYGVLIENTRMDANEVVNLRVLFCAPPGWTLFSVDYSNIEMRCAANISGEPEFEKEFLEGKGDFHSLTASKIWPEFTDPNTSKDVRKSYRNLAKIINFALLYGGTAYTIFENMKKKNPDITFSEAQDMVTKYWLGVPVFKEFCEGKQAIAKKDMRCTTATGRVINFTSQMDALHIHKPSDAEMSNYWDYRELNKKAEKAKKEGEASAEKAEKFKSMADRLWKNPETGVRNAMEYNKFMGKIQRVSVNVPLQGLAGDFMRIALNRIRVWALSDPLIQSVFRLHCSVHDEIDFIVKNEYVPFIIPRITRLMKLRKMHEKTKWKVPIECDVEYGRSWDVEHHVTGDDDHKPAAWTALPELANYIPNEFDSASVKSLLLALRSGEEARVAKVETFLKENLHPRAFEAAKHALKAIEPEDKKKFLIAALQLHEYWTLDNIPDSDDDKLENLESYESRNGLSAADRGGMPEMGYLGALSQTLPIKRPVIESLGKPIEKTEEPQVAVVEEPHGCGFIEEPVQSSLVLSEATEEIIARAALHHGKPENIEQWAATLARDSANAGEELASGIEQVVATMVVEDVTEPEPILVTPAIPVPIVEDVLLDEVKIKKPRPQTFESAPEGIPELIDEIMDKNVARRFFVAMGKNNGDKSFVVWYRGKKILFENKTTDVIPEEFLKKKL